MRNIISKGLVGTLFFCMVVFIYIYWDNNHITVTEQDIVINHLSSQLDGFKILQVSDLHEKNFGNNQKRLIKSINQIDYDAIVFTGDMLNNPESKNYKTIYLLIDGIKNKENALYIPGNADPENYIINNEGKLTKNPFVKGFEERGVQLLESIYSVKKEQATVHFVDFEMSILDPSKEIIQTNGIPILNYSKTSQYIEYQKELLTEMSKLNLLEESDVLIALNHYPVVDKRIDELSNDPHYKFRDYDLIMAGHYHGGQIRLPIFGALFVPEPWYDNNGLYPPKNRVKGLWEYNRTKQYVSAGLGSSDAVNFLKFRLFNPAEINVLTLKTE